MEKQRMTMILSSDPDDCTAQEVAVAAVKVAGGVSLISWDVLTYVPDDLAVDVRDQLEATLRDIGGEARVMVVWVGM